MAPAQEPNGDRTLGDPAAHRPACRNLGTSEQPSAARPNVLTQHGQEVLTLIGSGLSTAEAAERLFLSEGTVKAHVSKILAQLALRDRVQALALAYETSLIRPGSN